MRYYRNYGAKNINLAPIDDLVKVLPTQEQTGEIITFDSPFAGLPLKSHKIALTATQSGSGTPSPDNVRPISGYSAINIGSDAKYAGFINFNQVISDKKLRASFEANGVLFTKVTNGFELSGEANGTITTNYLTFAISYTNNHVYFLYDGLGELALWDGYHSAFSVNGSIVKWNRADGLSYTYFRLESGVTYSGTIKPQIFDLTAMFGSTKADEIYQMERQTAGSGVAYFRSLFPNDYYDYNAGTLTTVSAVNGVSNSMFTIQIGSTVYGGEYDARTGLFVATKKFLSFDYTSPWVFENSSVGRNFYLACPSDIKINQYAWNSTLICSASPISTRQGAEKDHCFISASRNFNFSWGETLDISTAQGFKDYLQANNLIIEVAAELATPTTIQLPPCPIDTLQGENNLFASTGDTTAQYFKK